MIDLQDKQEFYTIITIVKALKDADKKRDICKYGILKSKAFKLSSLNLFLTSKQFTDILSNGGLYTFASVKNAVIKLGNLSKDAQSVIFAHGSDVDLLINSDIPFYDKLTNFESLKDRLSL